MAANKKKDAEEVPEKKKGGKLKLLIVIVVLLILLGAGGFAAWKFFFQPEGNSEGNATAETETAPKEVAPPEVVKFDPFIVNLADSMGRRYLKITMDVEVATGTSAELTAALPKAKDSLLLLLSSKTFAEISSMDQKLELKNEIIERLNQVVGKGKIKNVYFTEFVVQ